MKHTLKIVAVAGLSFICLSGFGLKDLKKELEPDTDKCEGSSNESRCKNKEYLKSAAKVAAVTAAAKLIHDMVVDYRSKQVANDKKVAMEYVNKYGKMPDENAVMTYNAKISPNSVVEIGKPVSVDTEVKVVVGKKAKRVLIEERLEIFDNEQTDEVITSLTKTVHKGKGGAYENSFGFTLPKGLPQGVYPVKTSLIVDGKVAEQSDNGMQVVIEVYNSSEYRIAFIN